MSGVSVSVAGQQVGVAVSGGGAGSVSVSSGATSVSATVGAQGLPYHTHAIADVVGLQASLAGKASLNGAAFTGSVGINSGWAINGVLVTASAAEINIVDGAAAGVISADKAVVYDSTGGIFSDFVLAYNGFFVNDGYTDYFSVNNAGEVSATSIALSGSATLGGDLTVSGNLTVNGSTVTVNAETLVVEDKNIVLGSVAVPSSSTANGGGISLRSSLASAGDKKIEWLSSTDAWTSNVDFDLAVGKVFRIGGSQISAASLSNGTQGSGQIVLAGSPALAGTPTAPTATADTNTNQIATTAFVVGQGYLKSSAAAAAYQPIDADLTAIASLSTSANKVPYFTGSSTASLADFTAFGRSLIDDADAATARGTLGLATMATQDYDSVSITGGSIDGIAIDGGTW